MDDDLLDRLISRAALPLSGDTLPGQGPAVTDRLEALGVTNVPRLEGSPTEAPTTVAPGGRRLGRYALGELIGSGASGEVYEAFDPELRRDVAIKILRQTEASRIFVERFLTEAQVTAQLEHPGIVPVHDFGITDQGRIYLVMQRLRGVSLLELLRRLAHRDERTTRDWPSPKRLARFGQIAHAVAYAHSRGVVHRDLKPSNIMFGEFGEAVVMDWGIARVEKMVDDPIDRFMTHHTAPGTVLGTIGYMSPEQMLGVRAELGPPADVWALGVILFELLTVTKAFKGTFDQVCEAVTSGPLSTAGWDERILPARLGAVIARATSVKPSRRYPTAAEVAAEIDAFLSGT